MLFPSYSFLFLFLPLVLLIYHRVPGHWRNAVFTLASYAFYAGWDYRFCSLLLLSTTWDYVLGLRIHQASSERTRRFYLGLSLVLNLGLLGIFKYLNFFIDSFAALFPFLNPSSLEIVLPVGISFFTFQSMSYPIDVYRRSVQPTRSVVDFACYIAMFPQLVAGPIVRYHQIAAQLVDRVSTLDDIAAGLRRFVIGLAKKVLIADTCALVADHLFAASAPSMAVAWLAVLAYTLQIYFDFAGYSDMALGLGRMFGFRLPENFDFPYRARGMSDFWRRWHISLSAWFRDYLYIPLGGSRGSYPRTVFNLVLTMLLCGLWHGAAWTFVAWGGYHGLLIAIERPVRRQVQSLPPWLVIPLTTLLVMVGWVFFRLESFSQGFAWLQAMAGVAPEVDSPVLPSAPMIAFLLATLLACWVWPRRWAEPVTPGWAANGAVVVVFLLSLVAVLGATASPFLYYQF